MQRLTVLLLLCLSALAQAGPKPKLPAKPTVGTNIYAAIGGSIDKGIANDGTVYWVFTCVNMNGDLIRVGIKDDYIKLIEAQESKLNIDYP